MSIMHLVRGDLSKKHLVVVSTTVVCRPMFNANIFTGTTINVLDLPLVHDYMFQIMLHEMLSLQINMVLEVWIVHSVNSVQFVFR